MLAVLKNLQIFLRRWCTGLRKNSIHGIFSNYEVHNEDMINTVEDLVEDILEHIGGYDGGRKGDMLEDTVEHIVEDIVRT